MLLFMKNITILVLSLSFILAACAPESRMRDPLPLQAEKIQSAPEPLPEVQDPDFFIVGHRGARAIYPQNTLPSFDYALSVGADQIEFDTQYTSDNVVVINHDVYVAHDRCLTREGKKIPKKKLFIRNMTLEQVKRFDCGSLQVNGVPKYTAAGEKIPTIDELIKHVLSSPYPAARNVVFKFDIKYDAKTPQYFPSPPEIARKIVDTVKRFGIQNRSEFSAFEPRILEEIHKLDPKLKLAYLVGLGVNQEALNLSVKLQVKTFSPHYLGLKIKGVKKWIQRFHDKGIYVVPYTVNSKTDWKNFTNLGVDGLITDDPEGLRTFIESRGWAESTDEE